MQKADLALGAFILTDFMPDYSGTAFSVGFIFCFKYCVGDDYSF